jgi:hypothetical protein
MTKKTTTLVFLVALLLNVKSEKIFPGANENSPSRAQYFSWINNTNEGATEKQTLINLNFFKWLQDEYGMILDIYAFDAGAIDGRRFYGSIYSDRFKKQFPNGFDPIYKEAKKMGTRLGVWGGPDGFGKTKKEEKDRIDQMVKLCKDYEFELFKFDAVCGTLPAEKEDAFIEMMTKCRTYSPNLILLNHRLGLDKGKAHATTFLWGGQETYIDVHIKNETTAPHHRAGAMSRGLPPSMQRLTEDHGVCLSSCLNYWDDDLILQAFNRSLILAPEIYGNPWLLNDHEFSKLARIYNLHRKYGKILVKGFELPKSYGESPVSRGDDNTRIISLRNLNWEEKDFSIKLNNEIGLKSNSKVTLVQVHPTEKIIGVFNYGEVAQVTIPSYRAGLYIATTKNYDEPAILGSDFKVIRDKKDKSIKIEIIGFPGTSKKIKLHNNKKYKAAKLNRKNNNNLIDGQEVTIKFPGSKLNKKTHRKLGKLKVVPIPENVESLYEATVFAGDNNALECRELERSGKTKIPQVKAARDAFFTQKAFVGRGVWDKFLFDGDFETGFWPIRKYLEGRRIKGGCLRIDLGKIQKVDKFKLHTPSAFGLWPLLVEEGNFVEVSKDLKTWETITYLSNKESIININKEIRYLRFHEFPQQLMEAEAFTNGKKLDRKNWRASNLFAHSSVMNAKKVWKKTIKLSEIPKNSYLCVAINGKHGWEGAYAAAKIDGKLVGAPDRASSFQSNVWEHKNATSDSNYTYYIPVDKSHINKEIEVFVMGYDEENLNFNPELWISAYPFPYEKIELELTRKK